MKSAWTLEDENGTIELSKSLLPSDTQANQIYRYLKNPNSFKPINYQELFRVGRILYNNNIKYKNEILKFLRKSFADYFIQTSSGVLYKSKGKDIIIHDKGMPSESSFESDFIGPDRYIQKEDKFALNPLTGLENLDEIKEISQFLAKRSKTYLLRMNNKPDKDNYMVAGFDASSGRALLNCYGDPLGSYSGLGVRVAQKNLDSLLLQELKSQNITNIKELRNAIKLYQFSRRLKK